MQVATLPDVDVGMRQQLIIDHLHYGEQDVCLVLRKCVDHIL